MGKIFCVIGKSATGKDTIFRRLSFIKDLSLKRIIPYTTRPVREGEENGKEYFFCDEAEAEKFAREGRMIEQRAYNTMYGVWQYFTVDDGQIDLNSGSYLLIGTLESFERIRNYYGKDNVLPIYIVVEDGERLTRAISRERIQKQPKYEEMCRRFLADAEDFSEEKLRHAGIVRRFVNVDLEETIAQIAAYIRENI